MVVGTICIRGNEHLALRFLMNQTMVFNVKLMFQNTVLGDTVAHKYHQMNHK